VLYHALTELICRTHCCRSSKQKESKKGVFWGKRDPFHRFLSENSALWRDVTPSTDRASPEHCVGQWRRFEKLPGGIFQRAPGPTQQEALQRVATQPVEEFLLFRIPHAFSDNVEVQGAAKGNDGPPAELLGLADHMPQDCAARGAIRPELLGRLAQIGNLVNDRVDSLFYPGPIFRNCGAELCFESPELLQSIRFRYEQPQQKESFGHG
jgi:hypothetical protein